MTLAGTAVQAAVRTANGASISNGVWTLVGVVVTTVGLIATAIIKQWGPWKRDESDGRAADFERLRAEIASLKADHKQANETQNGRIEKLETAVHTAEREASTAKEEAVKTGAKLQTALTACELLLGLVEREMPDTPEIGIVKRLLAQAAADDLGVGAGMRKIAMMKGVGE